MMIHPAIDETTPTTSLAQRRQHRLFSLTACLVVLVIVQCCTYLTWFHPETTVYDSSEPSSMTFQQTNQPQYQPQRLEDGIISNAPPVLSEDAATTTTPQPKKWAYAFLMSDVQSENPHYRGIFYNVLVAAYNLRSSTTQMTTTDTNGSSSSGSTRQEHHPDIVLMIKLSPDTNMTQLPKNEEDILTRMNILYRYISSNDDGNEVSNSPGSKNTERFVGDNKNNSNNTRVRDPFYDLVLDKFRILEWTEYTRIMFLDGDVLPFCNLDYLLQLSEDGTLEETVLHAMYDDPVNAGLFVIRPQTGAYRNVLTRLVKQYGGEQWNATRGWGGSATSAANNNSALTYRYWNMHTGQIDHGTGWDFYCGNADQGLLLYWARYIQQRVSILIGPTLEEYHSISDHPSVQRSSSFLSKYSCLPPLDDDTQNSNRSGYAKNSHFGLAATTPVYQDFYHMVGFSKAWSSFMGKKPLDRPVPYEKSDLRDSREYWYYVLRQVQDEYDPNNDVLPANVEDIWKMVGTPKMNVDLISTVNSSP